MLTAIGDNADETMGYLKVFYPSPGAIFRHGCAVELYRSNRFDYFECEVHGPAVKLSPGEDFRMVQAWSLFPLKSNYEANLRGLVDAKVPAFSAVGSLG